jgi:hypothetical protein
MVLGPSSSSNFCFRQRWWWAKYEEKLIFDPSAQKTARLFDLQSIFASAPDVDHGEFFEA